MFEQAFRNIDDILRKEAGCTTELDYTEQTSWLLFLKYLDALEQDKADEAALEKKKYDFILAKPYRWEEWAAPKSKDGKLDHNKAPNGPDLIEFVTNKLFLYLHGFKQRATGPDTIEYKIGEIFGEIKNKIQSGYNLREIIDRIDELRFRSQTEKHELSHLYEAKIKNMGNAGRNGGEYYTPRPLIRAIVQVVNPKIGERIYDGACGSAGFLCESFDYLAPGNANLRIGGSNTPGNANLRIGVLKNSDTPGNANLRIGVLKNSDTPGNANLRIGVPKNSNENKSANTEIGAPRLTTKDLHTREERAAKAKIVISTRFNTKQQVFLDFVLSQYVKVGVQELDQEKLSPLLKLKYNNAIADAIADLGRPEEIGTVFSGFQKYLYDQVA